VDRRENRAARETRGKRLKRRFPGGWKAAGKWLENGLPFSGVPEAVRHGPRVRAVGLSPWLKMRGGGGLFCPAPPDLIHC
jgi:hypothetical protein